MRMDYQGSCLQYLDLYRHAIALSQNPWIYPRGQQLIPCDELSNSWLHSLHRHVRTILEICILHLIDHSLENRSKTEWCLQEEGITRTLKPRVYTNYYHACKQRRASPPTSVHFQEAQSDCIQYFILSCLSAWYLSWLLATLLPWILSVQDPWPCNWLLVALL